jgi:protocatechuate 3,4-dioxygenase beta subunit
VRRVLDALTWILTVLGCLALGLGPGDTVRSSPGRREVPRNAQGYRLCAQITDVARTPLSNVWLRAYTEIDGRYLLAGERRSQANGEACLDGVRAGTTWVLAEAGGYARRASKLTVQGNARLELTLELEHRIALLVLDELGQAIPRATVLVTGNDALPFGALTAADGNARIGRLPPPPWSVRAHAAGFESASADDVRRDLRLVLRRLSGIDVRVIDGSGKPVQGASVLIAGASLWPARRAETDADGLARLRALSEGSYDLRASRDQRVSATLHGFELGRGVEESVTLTLAPGRMITALVTDGDAEAAPVVAGADVVLVEGGVASFPLHGRSDRHGKVVLGPIAAGPATLTARAAEFVGGPLVVVPDVPEGPVRVPLVRGGRLRGVVIDDRDFPVEGAAIEVIGTDRYGLPIAETPLVTRFRAAHFEWSLGGPPALIPAGELGVMPGPVPPIPRGSFMAANAAHIDVASRANPPPATLTPSEPGPAPWVTNAGGEFDARPITPGRVRALVRHPDYVETVSDVVAVASGGEATVRVVLLRGGSVEGRVVDDRGFPIEGAQVSLIAERGTFDRRILSERDGRFAFSAAPAKVTLAVARPEEPSRNVLSQTLEVPENGRAELELVLPAPRGSVQVTVVDTGDRPIELAEVRVSSLAPEVPLRKTLFSGEDGRVEIADAAGLPLRLLIDAPRFSSVERLVDAAPGELRVTLDAGVIVSGRITAVRGRQGVPNAIVTLRGAVQRRSTSSDADGMFRFDSVNPGEIELRVSHPDYADAMVSQKVEATGRSDRPFELAPIDLEEPGSVEGQVVDADGNPVDGARVGVGFVPTYLPEGALPFGMALSDARGEFVLRGVRPGSQQLSAYAPEVGRGGLDAIEVLSGRSTTGVLIRLTEVSSDGEPFATGGLAVTLGERQAGGTRELLVLDVAQGSEAERGGLRAGDSLRTIDGQRPASMADARSRLAGRAGTDVVLELERASATVKLRITRQAIRR